MRRAVRIRRSARELALKVLYEHDIRGGNPLQSLSYLANEEGLAEESRLFAQELVEGVLAKRVEIDKCIASYSQDWRLERLAAVDRNILRLSLYELFYRPDIPVGVSINEAVELAKVYGDEDSSRFINGILGRIVREVPLEKAGGGGTRD